MFHVCCTPVTQKWQNSSLPVPLCTPPVPPLPLLFTFSISVVFAHSSSFQLLASALLAADTAGYRVVQRGWGWRGGACRGYKGAAAHTGEGIGLTAAFPVCYVYTDVAFKLHGACTTFNMGLQRAATNSPKDFPAKIRGVRPTALFVKRRACQRCLYNSGPIKRVDAMQGPGCIQCKGPIPMWMPNDRVHKLPSLSSGIIAVVSTSRVRHCYCLHIAGSTLDASPRHHCCVCNARCRQLLPVHHRVFQCCLYTAGSMSTPSAVQQLAVLGCWAQA